MILFKMSDFSTELPANKLDPVCECYKKLQFLGVPLYISEENDEYAERHEIPYESAFQLPGLLRINESITEYPIVEENELPFVFQQMAEVIPNLSDFELNVLSFWILDVFIEGLWTAQNARFPHEHQQATLQWIAFFFNYLQKNNPSRQETFNYLKTILFLPEEIKIIPESEGEDPTGESTKTDKKSAKESESVVTVTEVWDLPLPPDVKAIKAESGIAQQNVRSQDNLTSWLSDTGENPGSTISSEFSQPENVSDRNLRHTKIILEILYRIFARLWVFLEIQTAFHGMPPVEEVDLPFTLNVPKPRFKPQPLSQTKEKSGKKTAVQEKTPEEIESEKQEHKDDYILPLQDAEEAKSYVYQLFGPSTDRSALSKGKGGK